MTLHTRSFGRLLLLGTLVMLWPGTPSRAETLRVAALETPPFLYMQGGHPAGLEFEILDYFAKAQGLELEVQFIKEFDQVLKRLEAGEFDLAAATVSITESRTERFTFSAPYFPVRVVLVEPIGLKVSNLDALSGRTLATMQGTTYEEILRDVPNVNLIYGENETELMQLVGQGIARAAAIDSAIASYQATDHPNVHITIPVSKQQSYAFPVAKGSPLATRLSQHIHQLKASKIYFRLLKKYFGENALRAVLIASE